MNHADLEMRINSVSIKKLLTFTYENIEILTDGFNESLVRMVVAKGDNTAEQKQLLKFIREKYRLTHRRQAPDFLKLMDLDISCGVLIIAPNVSALNNKQKKSDSVNVLPSNAQIKELVEATKRIEELRVENEKLREERNEFEANYNISEAGRCDLIDGVLKMQEENEKLKEDIKQKEKELEEQRNRPHPTQGETSVDEMAIELLTPLFKDKKADSAKSFYEELNGKDDIGVTEVVLSHKEDFSPRLRNIDLWRILHAARKYSSTDRNFDTALRKGKFR